MSVGNNVTVSPRTVKLSAVVVIALSIGGRVPPNQWFLQWLGSGPGIIDGSIGVGVGLIGYTQIPLKMTATNSGCGNDRSCGWNRKPDTPTPLSHFLQKAGSHFDALAATSPRRIIAQLTEPPIPSSIAARETGIAKELRLRSVRGVL